MFYLSTSISVKKSVPEFFTTEHVNKEVGSRIETAHQVGEAEKSHKTYRKKCLFCSKILDSLMAWIGEKRKTEFS